VAALRQKFTGAAQDHNTEHYFVHKRALCVAEAYANATEPSKRGPGDHDGIHQKGRRGPRRRAGAGAAACAQGKNGREDDAHHMKKSWASSRAEERRR
jgi:hypothetical protein